jgi:carbonic anhydrase/acetyltransferase-like protein (isoleucine patch superfamily)
VYICDFDHVTEDIHVPIKDQGIIKSPVRIGADVWMGAKATVLRGANVGHGSVIAAHAVVRDSCPPFSIVGGVPARVLKDRVKIYEANAATRAALADIARKTQVAVERRAAADQTSSVSRLPEGAAATSPPSAGSATSGADGSHEVTADS